MKEFAGKKILILVENLPSPFDHRVWLEACALRDKGARVTIICPTGKGFRKRFELIDKIAIHRHPLPEAKGALGFLAEYGLALLFEALLAARVFSSRSFDVIHICNPPDLLYLVALPYKLLGKKILFDHHDLNPELYLAKFGKKDFFYRLMLFFERRTFHAADTCIATNESYRRVALSRGGKKPHEVEVVRSGPSAARLRPVDPVAALKRGRRILVGYVGVIGKQEGLSVLVDAASYLVFEKKRTDLHFIVVGDGPELPAVKQYAQDKKVAAWFTFTGRIPDRGLVEALSTADICVNTDPFNEMNDKSTMNKIMEYMALQKPIVQFDLTEGRVSAAEASLYARPGSPVDFAEKILELADDPEKITRMGRIGYERIQTSLSWDFQKERLYAVYRKLF